MPADDYKKAGRRIGSVLKKCRVDRGLTLETLAKQVGVSRYTLGQIENGSANPTLSMVWKIADGLSIPVSALLTEDSDVALKRSDNLLEVSSSNKAFSVTPVFTSKSQVIFDTYIATIKPFSEYESNAHNTGVTEMVTVIDGNVELVVDGKTFSLSKLDSIKFRGDRKHIYRNNDDTTAFLHFVVSYEGVAQESNILFD